MSELGYDVVRELLRETRPNGYVAPAAPAGWPEPPEAAAFHGIAGEFVETVGPQSEADEAALLTQYLAAAGNLFGGRVFHQIEGDRHPPRLWVAIVGPTAKARKGTAWGRVRQVAAAVEPEWAERISGGLSSGEGLVHEVRDPVYRQVKKKGSDKFEEKLEDPGVEDKRLLVVETELSRVFDVISRTGNTVSETLRRCWDGGIIASKTRGSPLKATDPNISVIGHISVEELRRKITDTEIMNGLGNRFMFIAARRSKVLPFGGDLDLAELRELEHKLAEAVLYCREREGRVSWSGEAAERWAEVYGPLSEGRSGMLGAVTARAEAHVVRLALTYALLARSGLIEPAHLEAALALWEFCARSAEWCFGDLTGDPVADAILEALKGAEDGLTRTEIYALLSRNHDARRITDALIVLLLKGLATMEKEETGGRPTERWRATG